MLWHSAAPEEIRNNDEAMEPCGETVCALESLGKEAEDVVDEDHTGGGGGRAGDVWIGVRGGVTCI